MINLLYSYRKFSLIFVLVLAAALTPWVQKGVRLDNSLKIWFLEDDPALEDYYQFQEAFGNDELVILMIKDSMLWQDESQLLALKKLSRDLEALPDVASVFGAGNARILNHHLLFATPHPLIATPYDKEQYERDLEKMPFLKQQLYSSNQQLTRLIIQLNNSVDFDDRRVAILGELRTTVKNHFEEKRQYWGGIGIIYEGLNALSQQDFGKFLMGGYILMFLLIGLLFRNFKIVGFAMSTIFLAIWYTLGIYGALDLKLNLMTIMMPLIIVLLGVLDVVHITYTWTGLKETKDRVARLQKTWDKTWKPCLFTSLTTMVGFAALLSTPMPILRWFGLFSAIGIALSLFFSWLLAPLFLPNNASLQQVEFLLNRTDWEGRFSKNKGWLMLSLLLILVSMGGLFLIKTNTYTYGYFPNNHEVVKDHEYMNIHWGNYLPLEIMVNYSPDTKLNDPKFIHLLAQLDSALLSVDGIDNVLGYHDFILSSLSSNTDGSNSVMLNRDEVKASYRAIKQYYPQLYNNYISKKDRVIRLTIFGAMVNSEELRTHIEVVTKMSNDLLNPIAYGTIAGYQPMYANIVDYVAQSQVISLLIALVGIFLLLWIFLTDWQLSAVALISNLFPLLVMFGFMGWMGIALDSATASVAAIALSFCIDDSMHFAYQYKMGLNNQG
ncbi:MAG: MMPL family transporter, partial [Reichenbachiella sp.]